MPRHHAPVPGSVRCFTSASPLACAAFLLLGAPPVSAQEEPAVAWTDRTMDLYVDAEPRPDASVLRSDAGDAWAVLLPDTHQAWVLGSATDDKGGGPVHALPTSAFQWHEALHATSQAGRGDVVGRWTEIEGGWVARAGEHAFVALPHQGPAGTLEAEELWRALPSWRRLTDAWRADGDGEAEAMASLARLAGPESGDAVTFEVAFGSWCGDSRRSVPKVLAAAAELGLEVSLVAIRRGFTEPLGYARDHRITNVPTILVRRHGVEIGRFIERPRSTSVITDLAALVERRPPPPPARFADGDVLVARGEYLLTAPDGAETGRESWSLFRTESGDTRLGSRHVGPAGEVTEAWQRWARAEDGGRTGFVEVTRDAPGERSRTRLWREREAGPDDAVHALTRGDAGGIVEQDLAVPADTVMLGPGVAARGLAWQAAGRPESARLPLLIVPAAGDGFAARLDDGELRHVARVGLSDSTLGDLTADHVVLRRGGARPAVVELWIHAELGIPVRTRSAGGSTELAWLEVVAAEPGG